MAARSLQIADGAGTLGAILAALCCAGTPLIVGALSAVGLSFVRRDAILWPLMLGSLLFALWGFWRGVQSHRRVGPIVLALAGALSLALGVLVVHGPRAMTMIYAGAAFLVLATIWNVRARAGQLERDISG
ncbi:MAG TPA: MerC domain-containing protein [Gemmatimonadaceae bacterium]